MLDLAICGLKHWNGWKLLEKPGALQHYIVPNPSNSAPLSFFFCESKILRNLQPVYQYHPMIIQFLLPQLDETMGYHTIPWPAIQPYQRMDGPSTGPWDWLWRRVPPNAGDEIHGCGQICCQNRLGFVEI